MGIYNKYHVSRGRGGFHNEHNKVSCLEAMDNEYLKVILLFEGKRSLIGGWGRAVDVEKTFDVLLFAGFCFCCLLIINVRGYSSCTWCAVCIGGLSRVSYQVWFNIV